MQKTVSAVETLGLDPSGETPINETFESAISGMANVRITFPGDGTFALAEQLTAQPDGPIELLGNGCTFTIPPETEMKSFVFVLPSGSLLRDIVIDQSASGALQEFGVQTNGVVRVDNVTINGYAPATASSGSSSVDAMFSPIAETENAVVRATNFTAVGGSAAGTHDQGNLPASAPENRLGAPMGIWVGQSNQGTIQLVDITLSGWSNGIYGGRTPGRVEVRGGTFVNNFNAQTRIGGGSVVDGASMLLDDRQWSDKGPFRIGHQGVYAARVDAKHGNTTDPATFKNCKIVAKSMREGAALFDWESRSGPGIVENCAITNHLDRPVFLGEAPTGVPAATNIQVTASLITGSSSAPIMEIHDRPQSQISKTCITTPDAGSEDIQGAAIGKDVSFGQCTDASGLHAPQNVGSGGNMSSLPAPNVNGSASTDVSASGGGWGGKLLGGLVAVPLVGLAIVFLPLFIGLLLVGIGTFALLALFFKKLGG